MAKWQVELTDDELFIITQAMVTAEDSYKQQAAEYRERIDREGDVSVRRFNAKIARLRQRFEALSADEDEEYFAA